MSVRHMNRRHWTIIAGFLAAISVQLGGAASWGEVTTPLFVAGLLGQGAVMLAAMFSDRPQQPWNGADRRKPGVR